jgi:hypothetical protein
MSRGLHHGDFLPRCEVDPFQSSTFKPGTRANSVVLWISWTSAVLPMEWYYLRHQAQA